MDELWTEMELLLVYHGILVVFTLVYNQRGKVNIRCLSKAANLWIKRGWCNQFRYNSYYYNI